MFHSACSVDCHTTAVVEDCAPYGLLITNGKFVSFRGPDPTMIGVKPTHTATVRFVNRAFWDPCNQIAKVAGTGTVGFSDCTFVQWDHRNEGRHALQVSSGSVIVRGCEFRAKKPQIELGAHTPGSTRRPPPARLARGLPVPPGAQ